MKDLLQPVLQSYPKLSIQKQSSPSYVSMYSNNKDEIVLVCAKNDQQNFIRTDNSGKRIQDDLDLTGSPLKVDLSLHSLLDETMVYEVPKLFTKEEESHLPVTIEKAREIANFYNKSLNKLPHEESTPMFILTSPSSPNKPLLLSIQSDSDHFSRGIVTYEGAMTLDGVDVDKLVMDYGKMEGLDNDQISSSVDCKYLLSGASQSHLPNCEDLLTAPHSGLSELCCDWSARTLITPYISCKVSLHQEAIIGHVSSPCNAVWSSILALHRINQLLVDMNAAGQTAVDLTTATIRYTTPSQEKPDNSKRLKTLLNQTETYAYAAEFPAGGCICITEDTTSLKQAMTNMRASGSSNDFTYRLWDILRDSESAEELTSLLIQALKFISSGQIRPFIDASNKSYLSKLVVKLSRGHSQASKFLKNLRTSPLQALSLAAQVGVEKTTWELTRLMALLDHSYQVASIWTNDARTHESIDQINQTIQDMTINGDFTLNPFSSLSSSDYSIRVDCDANDVTQDLTVDDFASLKKHGLVDHKDANEVPLIADDIDIGPWKHLLKRFAQVQVCLEHLYRAETCLMLDLAGLKPVASHLLSTFASDKSPVTSPGHLSSSPNVSVCLPLANNDVLYHLKKPAYWYRLKIARKESQNEPKRDSSWLYVYSQQAVFPPSVWQHLDNIDGGDTTMGQDLKYHCTKYSQLRNKLKSQIILKT